MKQNQAQAIEYAKDIRKRISVLMLHANAFDCCELNSLLESRQRIIETISSWKEIYNSDEKLGDYEHGLKVEDLE